MQSSLERTVRRILWVATPLVAMLGLASEIAKHRYGAPEEIVELFSLSYEANVPTWYASTLLFSCALALAQIASEATRTRAEWFSLSAIFVYMSIDEAVQIHEYLGLIVEGEGVLYFSWVIFAAIFVIALAVLYARFFFALPARSRWRFGIAGAIYVGGALVMELPLGAWTEAHGEENLGYALIDFVEEAMELGGASLFLVSLIAHRREAS